MNNSLRIVCIAILLWLGGVAQAEVINQSATGFNIKIELQVPATAARAYEQFLKVDQWWLASHGFFGASENFTIDPRAGGCFCEKSAASEVMHMLVTYVEPGKEVRMIGGLGPLQMMGAHGGMSWRFQDLASGGSKIIHTYNVSGYLDGGLDRFAAAVDGVLTQQLQSLAERLTCRAKL